MEYLRHQNTPNPFGGATSITYTVPEATSVTLGVYDVAGRRVALPEADRHRAPGTYDVAFDAGERPGGVYFYRLSTAAGLLMRSMVVLP